MKNKEIISTALAALFGLIALVVTSVDAEVNGWLKEHWMVVVFFFGLFLISLSLISLWVRFILKGIIKDYYIPLNNEINALHKKYDSLAETDQEKALLAGLRNSVAKSLLIRIIRFFI
jgi:hypothetical protein